MTDDEAFQSLVSGTDYPMFVVTTAAGGRRAGCLVGFLTQASIEPPRLLVLISKANHTYRVARDASMLAVHFLGRSNETLAGLFGEATGDETDKFTACEWHDNGDGVPVLEGTRGWASGHILDRFDCGDHVAHLIDVSRAEVDSAGGHLTFQAVRDLSPGHPA